MCLAARICLVWEQFFLKTIVFENTILYFSHDNTIVYNTTVLEVEVQTKVYNTLK